MNDALTYEREVLPLLNLGMTEQQAFEHLKNKTAQPIPCDQAKVLMEEGGLVIEDPVTRERSGSLVDRYRNMPSGNLKTLLGWFISHVFGRGQQISSDTHPRAVQVAAVLADLPPRLSAIGSKLLELGGGQPFRDITAQGVADAKAAYELAEAKRTAITDATTAAAEPYDAAKAVYDQAVADAEAAKQAAVTAASETLAPTRDKYNARVSWISSIDTEALTIAQIEVRIAEIMAWETGNPPE